MKQKVKNRIAADKVQYDFLYSIKLDFVEFVIAGSFTEERGAGMWRIIFTCTGKGVIGFPLGGCFFYFDRLMPEMVDGCFFHYIAP